MTRCLIGDCCAAVVARGLCSKHYYRLRRNGNPAITAIAPRGTSIADRLTRYSRRTEAGCLEWTGATTVQGYGKFQLDGKTRTAHRVGELHGMRKLTADDVREIRRIYANDKPLLATLADRFGVSRSQVSRIANYTNWKEPS